jgi:hypothetical protein
MYMEEADLWVLYLWPKYKEGYSSAV